MSLEKKKREEAFGRKEKTRKYNSVEETKTNNLRIQMLAELSIGILLKLRFHVKKNINDSTPSWSAVPFCVMSNKNDIRQKL